MKFKSGTHTRKHLVLFSTSPLSLPKTVPPHIFRQKIKLPDLYINSSADGDAVASASVASFSDTESFFFVYIGSGHYAHFKYFACKLTN